MTNAIPPLVILLVALAVGVYLVQSRNGRTDDPATAQPGSDRTSSSSAGQPTEGCARSLAKAEQMVASGVPVATQWKAYNNARSAFIRQEISEATRDARYNEAAQLGRTALSQYRATAQGFADLGTACTVVTDGPAAQAAGLSDSERADCTSRITTASAAVAAAAAVVGDWQAHIERLDALAAKKLDRVRYEQLWTTEYRTSSTAIDAFLGPEVDNYQGLEPTRTPSASQSLSQAPSCVISVGQSS